MDKLDAEMERTVSTTIDNKLVDYQISLSDNFYSKYLSFYDCAYTQEVVKSHRKFFQDLSCYAIYQKLGVVTKISIQARLSELDTLADISDNKDELELSNFDLKL